MELQSSRQLHTVAGSCNVEVRQMHGSFNRNTCWRRAIGVVALVLTIGIAMVVLQRYERVAALGTKVYCSEDEFVRGQSASPVRALYSGIWGVEISETHAPDRQFRALEPFASTIAFLRAHGPAVDDATIVGLGKFRQLKRLDVSKSHLSDVAVATLAQLTVLRSIDLSDCRVSDSGVLALRLALGEIVEIIATHLDPLPRWIDKQMIDAASHEIDREGVGLAIDPSRVTVLAWNQIERDSADLRKGHVQVRQICLSIASAVRDGDTALVAISWDEELRSWGPLEIVDGPGWVWVMSPELARKQAAFFVSQMFGLGWPIEGPPDVVVRRRSFEL